MLVKSNLFGNDKNGMYEKKSQFSKEQNGGEGYDGGG